MPNPLSLWLYAATYDLNLPHYPPACGRLARVTPDDLIVTRLCARPEWPGTWAPSGEWLRR